MVKGLILYAISKGKGIFFRNLYGHCFSKAVFMAVLAILSIVRKMRVKVLNISNSVSG